MSNFAKNGRGCPPATHPPPPPGSDAYDVSSALISIKSSLIIFTEIVALSVIMVFFLSITDFLAVKHRKNCKGHLYLFKNFFLSTIMRTISLVETSLEQQDTKMHSKNVSRLSDVA